MEMRKQGGREGQGTARSASKSPAGRKQTDEQTTSSTNQEASASQGATTNQGASMNQGTANQRTSTSPGASANQQTSSTQTGAGGQTGGEQDLLQHAKHATGEIMNKVQQQAGTQVNRGKETAASQLSQVANAVRRLGENLPEQEAGAIGHFVSQYGDKAANGIERLSTYIREQDPKRMLNDVQNFGRRQPALLLGGAFLLGFAGARLIRSAMETGSQYGSRQMNVQPTFTPQNVSAPRQSTTPGTV